MAFETTYNSQPAGSFTDYVTPIQPSDISGKPIPYVVPGFNSTEYGVTPHNSYRSNIAPDLANLVSELLTAGGAICGGIGGWKCAHPALPVVSIVKDAGATVKGECKVATLLPALRFVKTQLTESFGWLPLWQNPSVKMALKSGGRLCCRAAPALRGGLAGGVTGAVAGYITGYAAGAAADWCIDKVVNTYDMLTGTGNSR